MLCNINIIWQEGGEKKRKEGGRKAGAREEGRKEKPKAQQWN